MSTPEREETDYQKKRRLLKELRVSDTEPWKNKRIRFEHPFLDIDNAWRITGHTKREHHHEKCSYRTDAMLCDCAMYVAAENIIEQAWKDKEQALKKFGEDVLYNLGSIDPDRLVSIEQVIIALQRALGKEEACI